jgi:hypothetical protein
MCNTLFPRYTCTHPGTEVQGLHNCSSALEVARMMSTAATTGVPTDPKRLNELMEKCLEDSGVEYVDVA